MLKEGAASRRNGKSERRRAVRLRAPFPWTEFFILSHAFSIGAHRTYHPPLPGDGRAGRHRACGTGPASRYEAWAPASPTGGRRVGNCRAARARLRRCGFRLGVRVRGAAVIDEEAHDDLVMEVKPDLRRSCSRMPAPECSGSRRRRPNVVDWSAAMGDIPVRDGTRSLTGAVVPEDRTPPPSGGDDPPCDWPGNRPQERRLTSGPHRGRGTPALQLQRLPPVRRCLGAHHERP